MLSPEDRKKFEKTKEDVTKAVTGLGKIPIIDKKEILLHPILEKNESSEISDLSERIEDLTIAIKDLTEEITTLRHAIDDPSTRI